MKLIILLIVLGLERYFYCGQHLYRFNWFATYLDQVSAICKPKNIWEGYLGLALNVVPIIIIIGLIYGLLCWLLHFVAAFIFAIFIVLYCLGPKNLFRDLGLYLETKDEAHLSAEYQMKYDAIEDQTRTLTANSFIQFNRQYFAVIFWFIVFGVLGALFYRLIDLNCKHAKAFNSKHYALYEAALTVQGILDWIPVRLLGIGYALVGHFSRVFGVWIKNIKKGIYHNDEVNVTSGLAALDLEGPEPGKTYENKNAFDLIERTLILYLVVIAIFTLGAWIY